MKSVEFILSKQNAIHQVFNYDKEHIVNKVHILVDGHTELKGLSGLRELIRLIHKHGVDRFEIKAESPVEKIRINYFARLSLK